MGKSVAFPPIRGSKEQNELGVRGNEGLDSELMNHAHTSGQTRREDAELNRKFLA
jgi:hypothetical protein